MTLEPPQKALRTGRGVSLCGALGAIKVLRASTYVPVVKMFQGSSWKTWKSVSSACIGWLPMAVRVSDALPSPVRQTSRSGLSRRNGIIQRRLVPGGAGEGSHDMHKLWNNDHQVTHRRCRREAVRG